MQAEVEAGGRCEIGGCEYGPQGEYRCERCSRSGCQDCVGRDPDGPDEQVCDDCRFAGNWRIKRLRESFEAAERMREQSEALKAGGDWPASRGALAAGYFELATAIESLLGSLGQDEAATAKVAAV